MHQQSSKPWRTNSTTAAPLEDGEAAGHRNLKTFSVLCFGFSWNKLPCMADGVILITTSGPPPICQVWFYDNCIFLRVFFWSFIISWCYIFICQHPNQQFQLVWCQKANKTPGENFSQQGQGHFYKGQFMANYCFPISPSHETPRFPPEDLPHSDPFSLCSFGFVSCPFRWSLYLSLAQQRYGYSKVLIFK